MSDELSTTPAEQTSALDLAGKQSRRDFLKKAGLGTAAAAAVWVVPQVTSVGAQRAYAASTGPCIPRVIDFEGFSKGTKITNQIPGMTVSATGGSGDAMIFDTSNPTGFDFDLGTPNQAFAGPGIGTGGDGTPAAGINNIALGKVLIISEDGSSFDPDDNAGGGTITFVFDNPVSIGTVKILDIDNETSNIKVFSDAAGTTQIGSTANALDLGNNSVQTVAVNALGNNVRRMEVYFSSSGAVAEFVCPCPTFS